MNQALHTLWYEQPADRWQQALPLGNGRMGAMIYGGTERESIDLTESTFVSGEASLQNNRPGAPRAYHAAREALLNRDYAHGNQLAEGMTGLRLNFGSNLPVGRLSLDFEGVQNPREYRRSLDIARGVSRVQFQEGGDRQVREAFCSQPDDVLALHIQGNRAFTLRFESAYPATVQAEGDDLIAQVLAHEGIHSDGCTGVTLHLRLRVLALAGSVVADGNGLVVQPTGEALVLLAMDTDFEQPDAFERCARQLDRAAALTYDELLRRHSEDMEALAGRCALDMGVAPGLPTDQWLARNRTQEDDGALAALLFHYGRYLFLCSSRENSPLPAHLQGGWNDGVACRIGWSCDMHLDINTEMSYWPAHATGLTQCAAPLHRWIVERLMPSGQRTARETYGLPGWVAHTISNAWGYSAPGQSVYWGLHSTGGAWIATHLWEYWLYTGDRSFLRETAYPVLRGVAEFFANYLVRDPQTGYALPVPSDSPENSFRWEGKGFALSEGAYCDIVMIREVFSIFESMCVELGLEDDLRTKAMELARQLPPFRVGCHGQLQEWLVDFEEASPNHRHMSHLLSLFPFAQITPDKVPELAAAARVTMHRRMTAGEPWEDTGWARSLHILYSARLWDGAQASEHVRSMQRTLTNDNLFVFHPPVAGADTNVYELDGNTGLTSGIAEMLLQSQGGVLHLLPALPSQWSTGSVRGLCGRGGFVVDMCWQNGSLLYADITTLRGEPCRVRSGDSLLTLELKQGECKRIAFSPVS